MISDNDQDNLIWQSIGFLGKEEHLSFIYKKSEKIASALHLVSSLLKDTEPIKWEIREKGVQLLFASLSLSSIEPSDRNGSVQSFFSESFEIVSLLRVAHISGLISSMNFQVLKSEIESLVSLLKSKVFDDAAKAGYVLSDSFFKTDLLALKLPENSNSPDLKNPSLFGKNVPDRQSTTTLSDRLDSQGDKVKTDTKLSPLNNREFGVVKDKKDTRKVAILDLLRSGNHLTISDFQLSIKGCSAKTIQRELLELVAQGIIKKEGERRWSRYSIN